MIALDIEKTQVEQFLNVLMNGGRISVPAGGFHGNDVLSLAGCCFAAVVHRDLRLLPPRCWVCERTPTSREILAEHRRNRDLHAAIDVFRDFALAVISGGWDERFDQVVKLLVDESAYSGPGTHIVSGARSGCRR